jgi:hypothetical protein
MPRAAAVLVCTASLLLSGCALFAAGTTIQVDNESTQTGAFTARGPAGAGAGGTLGPCHVSNFFLDRGTWSLTISIGSGRFSDSVTTPPIGQGNRTYMILPTGQIETVVPSSGSPTDASVGAEPSPCG